LFTPHFVTGHVVPGHVVPRHIVPWSLSPGYFFPWSICRRITFLTNREKFMFANSILEGRTNCMCVSLAGGRSGCLSPLLYCPQFVGQTTQNRRVSKSQWTSSMFSFSLQFSDRRLLHREVFQQSDFTSYLLLKFVIFLN
jgi:hypothetical protein